MTDSFFTHAVRCSLVDYLDHALLLQLRDGSTIIGSLMTFDQYSNLVLGQCVQRTLHAPDKVYSDKKCGTQIIRGENVVLLGKLKERELKNWKLIAEADVKERQRKWRDEHAGDLLAREPLDEDWA